MARSFEPLSRLNDAGDQKLPTWRRAKPSLDWKDGAGDRVGKPRALAHTVGNANRCGVHGQSRSRIAKRIGHTRLALSRIFEDGRDAPHSYGQCGIAIYKLFCASGSDLPESGKVAIARCKLEQAGLFDFVDLRLGDAVQTIAAEGDPIDFLLNDIHPPVALPVSSSWHRISDLARLRCAAMRRCFPRTMQTIWSGYVTRRTVSARCGSRCGSQAKCQ
jgi:hypothetical protein